MALWSGLTDMFKNVCRSYIIQQINRKYQTRKKVEKNPQKLLRNKNKSKAVNWNRGVPATLFDRPHQQNRHVVSLIDSCIFPAGC